MPITAAGQQAVKNGPMGLMCWRVKITKFFALVTAICVVIFWVFMALRPAHARDQRAHDVVGKPRIVTRNIPGALMPPPKYDKLYDGELEIRLFSNAADVQQACKNISGVHSETGCARFPDDHKRCWLYLASEDLAK